MFFERKSIQINRASAIFIFFVAAFFVFVSIIAFQDRNDPDSGMALLFTFLITTITLLALGVYMWSVRATVGPEGVETHSILHHRSFMWSELQQFTYSEQRVRLYHIIPIYTSYRFKFVTISGVKATISGGGKKHKELGRELIEQVNELLVEPIWRDYENGQTLNFGKEIRLSKYEGLSVKGVASWSCTPVQELSGYKVTRGYISFEKIGGGKIGGLLGGVAISRAPNVFVLMCLLDRALGHPAALNDVMASLSPLG